MSDRDPSAPLRASAKAPSTRYPFDNLAIAWFLLLLGSLSFSDSTTAVALSGQLNSANLVRYSCVLAAITLLALELRHPIRVSLSPIWLYALYAVICLLSAVWSLSPIVTLGKAVELSAAVATVAFAVNRPAGDKALGQLFDVTLAFGAIILVVAASGYVMGLSGFYVRNRSLIDQLDTWFVSANGIGYVSALTATIALDRLFGRPKSWRLSAALYALSLTTAILAQGRTGLLAFVLGSLLVLAIHRRFTLLFATCGVMLLLGIAFSGTLEAYLSRGEDVDSLQTMSGRTVMWQAAWRSILDQPWIGLGYGVGGRSLFLTVLAGFGTSMSTLHNGFLEVLTGVGLLGFMPWIASLVWTLVNAFRCGLAGRHTGVSAIVVPVLATTVMSTGAGGAVDLPLAYFLCSTAILGRAALVGRSRRLPSGAFRST